MWKIQIRIDDRWHSLGGIFVTPGVAEEKIWQYMRAGNKQYRIVRA